MRILGIDPGYAIVGYAIIDVEDDIFNEDIYKSLNDIENEKKKFITCGIITTKSNEPFPVRLEIIFNEIFKILNKYKPDISAVESIYFQNNQKTAMQVSGARGVLILALKIFGTKISEYTPGQVKFAVTGNGKAKKHEIIKSTKKILNLNFSPTDDAADAIAIIICHLSQYAILKKTHNMYT